MATLDKIAIQSLIVSVSAGLPRHNLENPRFTVMGYFDPCEDGDEEISKTFLITDSYDKAMDVAHTVRRAFAHLTGADDFQFTGVTLEDASIGNNGGGEVTWIEAHTN